MSTHAILLTIVYTCLAMAAAIIGCLVWAFWPRRAKLVDPLVELYDTQPLALPAGRDQDALDVAAGYRSLADPAPRIPIEDIEARYAEELEAEPVTPPHGNAHLAELVHAAVERAMRRRHNGDVVDAVVVPDAATTVAVAPPRDPDATGEWPVYEARPIAKDTGHIPRHAADDDGTTYLRRMSRRLTANSHKAYNTLKLEKARSWREDEWVLTAAAEVARLRRRADLIEAEGRAFAADIAVTLNPRRTGRALDLVPVLVLEAVG